VVRFANSQINKSQPPTMGWKCSAETRARLLAGAEWGSGVVAASGALAKSLTIPLPTGGRVCVDANAMLRSKAFARLSAVDIAKSMLTVAGTSMPRSIEIFFDSDDSSAYPPQRAAVHAERYPASSQLPASEINAIAAKFGATSAEALATTSADPLPLRTNRKIDWQKSFTSPLLKAFLWRILAEATRHVAVMRMANGELDECTVQIHAPDGTVETVGMDPDFAVAPRRFAEADLQTFNAGRVHADAKQTVIIYSIDTDFLLMTAATIGFMPSVPFIIHLKSGVTDGRKLIERLGGKYMKTRINNVFWLLSLGCDYAEPLTKQGYYTRGLTSLVGSLPTPLAPALAVVNDTVTLDVASVETILGTLKCRAQSTKSAEQNAKRHRARPPLQHALGDLLFCLRYYGFMFPVDGAPYPPASTSYYQPDPNLWQFQLTPTLKTTAQKPPP
jgi:hypothetical protein